MSARSKQLPIRVLTQTFARAGLPALQAAWTLQVRTFVASGDYVAAKRPVQRTFLDPWRHCASRCCCRLGTAGHAAKREAREALVWAWRFPAKLRQSALKSGKLNRRTLPLKYLSFQFLPLVLSTTMHSQADIPEIAAGLAA